MNVKLNNLTNVKLLNRGISNAPGAIELLFDPLMPGAGSGDGAINDQIGGSVKSAQKISILVERLDDEVGKETLPRTRSRLILKAWNFRHYRECIVC